MKKLIAVLVVGIFILEAQFLSADLPGQAPTSINKPNPNPFPKAAPSKQTPPHKPNIKQQKPTVSKEGGIPFTLPGIVGLRNGQWVGSDNLYNVSSNISVYVEMIYPENQKIFFNEGELKAKVQAIFTKGGITPFALHQPETPALPLFHVLIMLNQVEPCIMASCSCRLFEAVTIKRAIFDEGITFQAITWEKQDLIASGKQDFTALIEKTVEEFATEFVERFKYFQNLRLQHQEK